jgi:serine/threonine protein phosphatase PrpC
MDKNYYGITDPGKVRDNNEDTFIAARVTGTDRILSCVIDGVGGYSGGEIAAEIARESVLEELNTPGGDVIALMKAAIALADERIMQEKLQVKEYEKMACVLTLAVIDLEKNLFYYAHVGDTRLYLLRDQTLVKISRDQSFVGFMEDTGRLTEEQAMRHPKRNEINKALGFGINVAGQEDYIETGQSPFLPGDVLMLCSDGLSDMVNKQEMTAILTTAADLRSKAEQLVATANKNGGRDNITVVLVQNDKQVQVHAAAKPASKPAKTVAPVIPAELPQPAAPRNTEPAPASVPAPKGSTAVPILAVCCILLLAVIAFLLWQNHRNETAGIQQQKLSVIKPPRNKQEKKLQDTLNKMTGNLLILTDSLFKSPILITEPLQFNKDTIYLIAEKGITIKRDSSFTEVPIRIMPESKHVLLENFTFEDFPTVISSQSNALVFKNVRFVNCPNAIQIIYNFSSGKYINGKLQRSSFKTDSLATPVNP